MSRQTAVAIWVLALILLFTSACQTQKAQSAGGPPAVPVSIAPVTQESVPIEIHAVGRVEASAVIQVKSLVAGEIVRVAFTEGAIVNQGDLLFEIDPRQYQQAVRQAEGKLSQSKADLRSAQTAPQQVSLRRAQADAADAQVDQRRAQLAQTQLNFSYTIIRSPVTGIIGKKSVEVGQNVSIGQEMLEVVPLNDVWVTANFKETQLEHMRPGQRVKIKVDAYGRTWYGHVSNMGGGTGSVFSLLPPENATGNYVKVVQRVPVRIDFDRTEGQDFNAEGMLKPGLSVVPDVRVR